LIALSHRTISASYRSFLGDAAVDAFLGSGSVEEYVASNVPRCFVILHDDAIVGYSVCRYNLIDLMMIDGAVQRQGLGSRLLAQVEALLFASHDELRLESFEENANANAFYRKHGWLEASRHFDTDVGTRKIVFRKLSGA
jgi:ribosomal protein S18 acetylase RimI-like enzyme